MNLDKTHIVFVLDQSGSMMRLRDETVTSVNAFIRDQAKAPGEATFTLAMFAFGAPTIWCQDEPMSRVRMLGESDYAPANYTALLDAVGTLIDVTGNKLAAMGDDLRPGKVVFVVLTDGQENASRDYTLVQVRAKIKHQQERYNWQFVFLGVGPEAFTQAEAMNFAGTSTMSWDPSRKGIAPAVAASNNAVLRYRSAVESTAQVCYTDAERFDNAAEPKKGGGFTST